jgi:hypothetical protein
MLRCSPDEAAALLSDLVCRGRARAHRRDGEACYTAAE